MYSPRLSFEYGVGLGNRKISHHSEMGIKVRHRLERCGGRLGV
jgi:hypothetical protein